MAFVLDDSVQHDCWAEPLADGHSSPVVQPDDCSERADLVADDLALADCSVEADWAEVDSVEADCWAAPEWLPDDSPADRRADRQAGWPVGSQGHCLGD